MELGSKSYRLLDPQTRKIVVSTDVVFDETRGWNLSTDNREDQRIMGSMITSIKNNICAWNKAPMKDLWHNHLKTMVSMIIKKRRNKKNTNNKKVRETSYKTKISQRLHITCWRTQWRNASVFRQWATKLWWSQGLKRMETSMWRDTPSRRTICGS